MDLDQKTKLMDIITQMEENLNMGLTNLNNMMNNLVQDDNEGETNEEVLIVISEGLLAETPEKDQLYVERIVHNYNLLEFAQNFRISRQVYELLLQEYSIYVTENQSENNLSVPLDKQILSVVWLFGTLDSYASIVERFDMTQSTLSSAFFRIIKFLNRKASSIIKWPSDTERINIKNYFENHNAPFGLKGVIGAMDGIYVRVKPPKHQITAYTNQKSYTSVTLQAICDHKMKFIDCFIGYPSSVIDNQIFKNSIIYQEITQNFEAYFSEREKILVDKAYAPESWCITPFINRGQLTNKQTYFNFVHESRISIIERSFSLYFCRFKRLQNLDMNNTDLIPATILAVCVLHNLCIDFDENEDSGYISEGLSFLRANNPNESVSTEENVFNSILANEERFQMMQEIWERKI